MGSLGERKVEFEAEKVELQRMLKRAKDKQMRQALRADLAQTERVLQIIGKLVPPGLTSRSRHLVRSPQRRSQRHSSPLWTPSSGG